MADIVEKISFEFDNTGINVASNAIEGLVQKLDDLEAKAKTTMGVVDDAIKAAGGASSIKVDDSGMKELSRSTKDAKREAESLANQKKRLNDNNVDSSDIRKLERELQQADREAQRLFNRLHAMKAGQGLSSDQNKLYQDLKPKYLADPQRYSVDSSDYISETNKMITQDNMVRKSQDGVVSSLSNTRYALYDVSAAYAMVAGVVGAMAATPIALAVNYEAAFADVVRTAGLATDEISSYQRELEALTHQMPTAFTDISEVAALGGQLGIAKEDIVDFTSVVARLSETSDLTTESAGTMIGRFAAINDVASYEYEKLASSVLKVGINSMATESDIANVSLQISSMGNIAGMTAEQIVGLAGGMASVGVAPELSRSVVTQTFTKIDNAVRDSGEELERFASLAGVTADEFKAAWGTDQFSGLFVDMLKGLRDAGTDGSQVLADLGITSLRTVPSLLRMAQGVEVIDGTMRDASSGWLGGTELMEQYGIIADTTSAKLEMLKNQLASVAVGVGEGPNNIIAGMIESLAGIVSVIDRLLSVPVVSWLASFAVGVGVVVSALAAWNAAKAIVIASEYALQTAMSASGSMQGSMLGAVVRLAGGFKNLSTSTAENTVATTQNTASKASNIRTTQALAATTTGASSSIRAHTTAMAGNTVATGASTAATTGLGRAMSGVGGLVRGVTSLFSPFNLAIMGGVTALGFLGNKLYESRQEAQLAEQNFNNLSSAVRSDTASFEQGAEAFAMFSKSQVVANGEVVDSYSTQIQAIDGSVSAKEQAAFAEEQLRARIGDTTGEIQTQTFYLGENTQELIRNRLQALDSEGVFRDIATHWSNLGDYAPDDMVQFFEDIMAGGAQAEGALMSLGNSMGTLNDDVLHASDLIREMSYGVDAVDTTAFEEGSERVREFAMELENLTPEERLDALAAFSDETTNLIDSLTGLRDSVSGISPEFDSLREEIEMLGADAEVLSAVAQAWGVDLENMGYSAEDSAYGLDTLSEAAWKLEADMYGAMFSMGQSLANNGYMFDVYSQGGRANMFALDSALQAAAANSGGSATAMSQHAMAIIDALIQAGVSGVDAMNMVNEAGAVIAQNTGMDWIKITKPQFKAFQASLPAINNYNSALNEGFNAGNRSARGSRNAGRGARKAGNDAAKGAKQARQAAKEIRTITDYVNDLKKVMKDANDFRWGLPRSLDDTADGWQKLKEWSEKAAEAIKDAREDIDKANKSIRDAKADLQEINAELSKLYADRDIIEFKYRVAVEYGDTLRANELKADLDTNSADITKTTNKRTDAKVDLDTGNADLATATKELAKAQKDAKRDLSGTTESARDQRDMVWSLIDSYQDQIEAYAATGASQDQVRAYAETLRGEFEQQLLQMGYNRAEVDKYSQSFSDMTTIISRVPRNLTVAVDANPAIRALQQFEAQASRSSSNASRSLGSVGGAARNLGGALGGIRVPGINTTPLKNLDRALNDVANRYRLLTQNMERLIRVNRGRPTNVHAGVGLIPGLYSSGGFVQGGPGATFIDWSSRGTDTVPAMLTPGEFVINRTAAQALGAPLLNHLNQLRPGSPVSVPSSAGTSSGPNIQLVELVPAQEHRIVNAAARQAQIRLSGGDMSRASTTSNRRAIQAGVN